MKTKHYLLIAILASFSFYSSARTKFEVEYHERSGSVNAKVRSSLIAENVIQVAHPKLNTYLRVESSERADGNYDLQMYVKDLKTGNVLASPRVIARPGELSKIEVGGQYKVSVRATPN